MACRAIPESSTGVELSAMTSAANERPVVLFDVMSTLVSDPFYEHFPRFFGLTFQELLQQKHPSSWKDFEHGHIEEEEFLKTLFLDGRDVDGQALRKCMADNYEWLPGCEELLKHLHAEGCELHAFSNYPVWYTMIEDKLQLSRYLQWSLVSANTGYRKPARESFEHAASTVKRPMNQLIFVDDSKTNIEAAAELGITAIHFTDAQSLAPQLFELLSVEPVALQSL